jgi:type VI secretion system VasI family protein
MARLRGLVLATLLQTIALGAATGFSQEIPAEVKSCKAIADDGDRLKCFDGLFGGPSTPPPSAEKNQVQQPGTEKQANWSIDEKQSPEGNAEVVGLNFLGNDAVLILRCRDQIIEAAYSTNVNYLGYQKVDVEWRINDQSPVKQVWNASMNGRAAFAPDAIAFIESLPDNAKLSIKTTRSTDGRVKEGKFDLGAVSEVRSKIAKACDWADAPEEDKSGSIDQEKKRRP